MFQKFKNQLAKPPKRTGAKLKGTGATVAAMCIVCVLFFTASGCNKQDVYEDESFDPIESFSVELPVLSQDESIALAVQKKGTYEISESEAIEKLERFAALNRNDGGISTKRGISENESSLQVKSVKLKKNAKTGKDLYYEVVFESEKGTGFSLVSADERVDDVLCYSEVGSIADTSFNKSLKFCLELVDLYVEEQTKAELDIESLSSSANKKILDRINEFRDNMSLLKAVPPLDPNNPSGGWYCVGSYIYETTVTRLKTIKGGWHQEYPYNDLLPPVSGIGTTNGNAYVGCNMVAVAQIMSYHKKKYTGSNFTILATDWPAIIDNPLTSSLLQKLMKDLFNNMFIIYDKYGTGSSLYNAIIFLHNNGFIVGPECNYTYNNVWDALQYGPTSIAGDRTNGRGHAWVVDGAKTEEVQLYEIWEIEYNGKIIQQTPLIASHVYKSVRFDWGDKNLTNNTWFQNGVFEAAPGYNYNVNVKMISHIVP